MGLQQPQAQRLAGALCAAVGYAAACCAAALALFWVLKAIRLRAALTCQVADSAVGVVLRRCAR
jgi:hypothetical protein